MSNEDFVARELDSCDHAVVVPADVEYHEATHQVGRWKGVLQVLRVAPASRVYHLVPGAQPLLSIPMHLPEDSQPPLADHPHWEHHVRKSRTDCQAVALE